VPSARSAPAAFAAVLALAAASAAFAGCTPADDVPIAPDPPPAVEHGQGVAANANLIEFAPLGFKINIAFPAEGHLCVILPESAQDPTACMGLSPSAMIDALPEGPERPFGAAYARMGDWSYIVMLAPAGTGIESREDIEEFVGGAEKGVRDDVAKFFADSDKGVPAPPSLLPRLIVDTPNQKFDLIQVNRIPVVKFRIDAPYPPDSPQYDAATTMTYVAFGQRAAMVSILTSPKDAERVKPYADATIQSIVLPPRQSPELFGKPRAELDRQNARVPMIILGSLVVLGGLLFFWLARSQKAVDDQRAEDEGPPAPPVKRASPAAKGKGKGKAKEDAPSEEDASREDASSEDDKASEEDEKASED
jgi:hypothetical protein